MGAMRNPAMVLKKHNQFSLKMDIFDLGRTIDCVNITLTFYFCSHKHQFGKAD